MVKFGTSFAFTMRAWPVARSIFDAPLCSLMLPYAPLCERSERGDNKLDNFCFHVSGDGLGLRFWVMVLE